MIIEFQQTSSGNPPGATGMAVSRGTTWVRFDGGEWRKVHLTRGLFGIRLKIVALLELDPLPEEQFDPGRADELMQRADELLARFDLKKPEEE